MLNEVCGSSKLSAPKYMRRQLLQNSSFRTRISNLSLFRMGSILIWFYSASQYGIVVHRHIELIYMALNHAKQSWGEHFGHIRGSNLIQRGEHFNDRGEPKIFPALRARNAFPSAMGLDPPQNTCTCELTESKMVYSLPHDYNEHNGVKISLLILDENLVKHR